VGRYEARCVGVKDGDTFVCHYQEVSRVPGFRITTETDPSVAVRLLGVSCPEKRAVGGSAATSFAVQWFQRHFHDPSSSESHGLWIDTAGYDHFGRLLAIVSCMEDGANLNAELLQSGNATVYRAGPDLEAHVVGLRKLALGGPGADLARMVVAP
jgi:endonuclease YncB( thermonuclease family)